MEGLFKEITSEEFNQSFITEEACYAYLAETKWKDGFVCRKCGNTNFCKGKTPHSRRCTRCKKEESATAHTPFHHCKVPLVKAFEMAFMICHSPRISTYELSRQEDLRQMTCWKLKKKILECLEKDGEKT